jgi:putative spermidine/putrescine transport system substrate-binding protein
MITKNKQEGLTERGLTRRQFLKKSVATAGVAAGLSAGLSGLYHPFEAKAAQNQVTFCSWGGALSDAQRKYLFKPFTDETGIAVNEATLPLIAKIKAMVDTGNIEWDIVAQDMLTIISLQKAGNYLEKIDYNLIDKASDTLRHRLHVLVLQHCLPYGRVRRQAPDELGGCLGREEISGEKNPYVGKGRSISKP